MGRSVKISKRKFMLEDEVELVFEKVITPFGSGAKIDAPKRYIGYRAYVIITKDKVGYVNYKRSNKKSKKEVVMSLFYL